jgi:hypothetical protein
VLENSLCTTCRDANWFRSFTQKGGNVNLAFTSLVVTEDVDYKYKHLSCSNL